MKLGSSKPKTVKSCEVVAGQAPEVVYSIVYVVPFVPLVTSPVTVSIVAPSVGTGLKANVPPANPVTVAVPPSHVGVIVKLASSPKITLMSKSPTA